MTPRRGAGAEPRCTRGAALPLNPLAKPQPLRASAGRQAVSDRPRARPWPAPAAAQYTLTSILAWRQRNCCRDPADPAADDHARKATSLPLLKFGPHPQSHANPRPVHPGGSASTCQGLVPATRTVVEYGGYFALGPPGGRASPLDWNGLHWSLRKAMLAENGSSSCGPGPVQTTIWVRALGFAANCSGACPNPGPFWAGLGKSSGPLSRRL